METRQRCARRFLSKHVKDDGKCFECFVFTRQCVKMQPETFLKKSRTNKQTKQLNGVSVLVLLPVGESSPRSPLSSDIHCQPLRSATTDCCFPVSSTAATHQGGKMEEAIYTGRSVDW